MFSCSFFSGGNCFAKDQLLINSSLKLKLISFTILSPLDFIAAIIFAISCLLSAVWLNGFFNTSSHTSSSLTPNTDDNLYLLSKGINNS